jgi:hypothetical protein
MLRATPGCRRMNPARSSVSKAGEYRPWAAGQISEKGEGDGWPWGDSGIAAMLLFGPDRRCNYPVNIPRVKSFSAAPHA